MVIIPNGAQKVIDARKRGFKPAEMLIISLCGTVNELNHTIYANPDADYDWRWMIGLKACIFVKSGVKWRKQTMDIARANPDWLGFYDVDRFEGAEVWAGPFVDDIEKPSSQWRWKLNFIPWMPSQNREFSLWS